MIQDQSTPPGTSLHASTFSEFHPSLPYIFALRGGQLVGDACCGYGCFSLTDWSQPSSWLAGRRQPQLRVGSLQAHIGVRAAHGEPNPSDKTEGPTPPSPSQLGCHLLLTRRTQPPTSPRPSPAPCATTTAPTWSRAWLNPAPPLTGPQGGARSQTFLRFRELVIKGFQVARRHADKIIAAAQLALDGAGSPPMLLGTTLPIYSSECLNANFRMHAHMNQWACKHNQNTRTYESVFKHACMNMHACVHRYVCIHTFSVEVRVHRRRCM